MSAQKKQANRRHNTSHSGKVGKSRKGNISQESEPANQEIATEHESEMQEI